MKEEEDKAAELLEYYCEPYVESDAPTLSGTSGATLRLPAGQRKKATARQGKSSAPDGDKSVSLVVANAAAREACKPIQPTATKLEDPLFLDGCRVALQWPRRGIRKPAIKRVGIIKYLPKATMRRRHERNTYVIAFDSHRPEGRQPPRERWTRWSRLKGRQLAVVEGTGRKPGRGNWTELEGEAIVARKAAGEADESIGVSLGRSRNAVSNRRSRLTKPGYAPLGHGNAGISPDRSVKWIDACERALELLPHCRGTVREVVNEIERLGYQLDESLTPGHRCTRGQSRIANALSRLPQFVKTGAKKGVAGVYEYRPELAMSERPPAQRPKQNAKTRRAGYDNVTMKVG